MATVTATNVGPRGALLLHSVPWKTYVRLLKLFEDRRLRITYDRGVLEVMTLSAEHERFKSFLRRLFEVMVLTLGVEVVAFGSMTFRKRTVRRGLEPDECYYIANEPLIRGRMEIDLRNDPPPDLAMEVDITRSSLGRLSIYAKLQIPEVWRFDGQILQFHHLGEDGRYSVQPFSRAFPRLRSSDLQSFLLRVTQEPDGVILEAFRGWVLNHLRDDIAQP